MRHLNINRRRTSTIVSKCSKQTDPKGDFQYFYLTCFILQREDVKVNLFRDKKTHVQQKMCPKFKVRLLSGEQQQDKVIRDNFQN